MILEFLVILKFEMAKLTSYFLKTEVQLMYNVLVSGIQQSDSVYIYIYTHTHIHIYIYIHTHTYTYTYIYKYICMYSLSDSFPLYIIKRY